MNQAKVVAAEIKIRQAMIDLDIDEKLELLYLIRLEIIRCMKGT